MKIIVWIFFCVIVSFTCGENVTQEISLEDAKLIEEGEKTLRDQILMILEHYKEDDPVGLPGAQIPDPKIIPDMKQSFSVATMTFKDMKVYGLSKFRIGHIKSELSSMEVNAALTIDSLITSGNYTMATWVSRSRGPFEVKLTDVYIQGLANLGIERNGKLQVQDINLDLTFGKISMNFENLGFMGSMFQGILNSVGTFLFDSIKPYVLKDAYSTIRNKVNENLDKVVEDVRFPNSISPLDMVISDARKKVRGMGLDPFYVKDYNSTSGVFQVLLTHTWLTGISSFHRVGNISLSMINKTLIADIEIGTQKLEGQTQWEVVFMGGLTSRAGTATFSVEYISARITLGQSLDTTKHPEFRDLQLEIGNIQVRWDGAGTLDYAVEFLVNILPNLLRYQIIDAIEGPIQDKVQEMFNNIHVEELIKSKISDIEEAHKKGFKLSSLKYEDKSPQKIEEDEFWRFNEPPSVPLVK